MTQKEFQRYLTQGVGKIIKIFGTITFSNTEDTREDRLGLLLRVFPEGGKSPTGRTILAAGNSIVLVDVLIDGLEHTLWVSSKRVLILDAESSWTLSNKKGDAMNFGYTRNTTTLNLLEQALENEEQIFCSLISSLSKPDILELAVRFAQIESRRGAETSDEPVDAIVFVAKNIKNITDSLQDFYVT
jgi:hypothetical protein